MALSVDIRKRLGDFRLDVRFETENVPLALLGASGCGKTVTLRCIAGLMRPDEGRILLDGVSLFDSAAGIDLPPQKRGVGCLFQSYALFPHMTVRQNIAAGVRDKRRREETVSALLRQFRLEDAADKRPAQLSGGQQQRTALARILASEPKVILLDEPFSALDGHLRRQLEPELTDLLAPFGGDLVWVSHDRGEVYRNCRRICVLENGRSQGVFPREELFRRPATEAAARISGCPNFSDAVCDGPSVRLTAWGLTLPRPADFPADARRAGVRADAVRPAAETEEGAFPCRILRVIEDLSSTAVLLQSETAPPDAPPLWMELPHADPTLPDRDRITVRITDLLPLR